MRDLIERQQAIEALTGWETEPTDEEIEWTIKQLPSAGPQERNTGRWIKLDMHRGMEQFKCSACDTECYVPTCMGDPMYEFCPNCGCKMEVEHD